MLPNDDHVVLEVFDMSGKRIHTLYEGEVNKQQEYKVQFDGTGLPSGLYIYRMTTNTEVYTGKMNLMK
jgi:hypothetical protein